MKQILALCIALFSLFAVVLQYDLMMNNSVLPALETTIRFFSFFTILTNIIVAGYFSFTSYKWLVNKEILKYNLPVVTAITVYITIVGLVYQVLLRHTWNPAGMQRVVDELLHSVNPLLVIAYWVLNRKGRTLKYQQIGPWLLYPLGYLVYVLMRGTFSGFYPYPFLDVNNIGWQQVIINSIGMTIVFVVVSILYVWVLKLTSKNKNNGSVAGEKLSAG